MSTPTSETCPDCGRPKAQDADARTQGCKRGLLDHRGEPHRSRCLELTVARLKSELATVEELRSLCLQRGRAPTLDNQVRLNDLCLALALRAETGVTLRCDHHVVVTEACDVCGENSVQRFSAYGVTAPSGDEA